MTTYAVQRLARMAGVSVRTLHHYDHIGLLKPSGRSQAGYRLYREKDLLQLQQILFFKELDFSLSEIRRILSQPDFNPLAALENHKRMLRERTRRLALLLKTIDKTIATLTEEQMTMKDEELYEGFTKEQIEHYRREARRLFDPAVVEKSEQRVRKMSKEQWKSVKKEGEEITQRLAGLMHRKPGDPEVQKWIGQHHAHIERFYQAPAAVYRGLGGLYVEHPEFKAHYEKYQPGLAEFMKAAMEYYCVHTLKG